MDKLQAVLNSLPAGTNPYAALDTVLWAQLDHHLPKSFFTQQYALAGIMAFDLIILVLIIVLRIRFGRFWVFRIEAGSVRPHGTQQWELGGIIFLGIGVVSIFVLEPYYRGTSLVRSMAGLRTMIWFAPWIGGATACHSLTSAYLAHLESQREHRSETVRRWHRILTYCVYAMMIAFLASVAPFCAMADRHWNRFADTFEAADAMLRERAASWVEGPVAAADLTAVARYLGGLSGYKQDLMGDMRVLFALYASWTVVLCTWVNIAAFLHIKSLGRLLRRARLVDIDASGTNGTSRQTRAFEETYQTRIVTVTAFSVICVGFTGVSLYIAVLTEQAFTNPSAIQAVSLAGFYLYGVLGVPVVLLLLHRVFRAEQLSRHRVHFALSGSQTRGSPSTTKLNRAKPNRPVTVDVSTVVSIHEEREDEDGDALDGKPGAGVQAFEMVSPGGRYLAPTADGDEKEPERVKELYFLSLEGGEVREKGPDAGL